MPSKGSKEFLRRYTPAPQNMDEVRRDPAHYKEIIRQLLEWSEDEDLTLMAEGTELMSEAAATIKALGASDAITEALPDDPWAVFAFLVAKCGEGFGRELMKAGRTETQAKNAVIGCLLDFAAGEACRLARSECREPDPEKWRKATTDAFDRAVKRTSLYGDEPPEVTKMLDAFGERVDASVIHQRKGKLSDER
jgi:hypothetical protein